MGRAVNQQHVYRFLLFDKLEGMPFESMRSDCVLIISDVVADIDLTTLPCRFDTVRLHVCSSTTKVECGGEVSSCGVNGYGFKSFIP